MNKLQMAEQMRRALQKFAQSLSAEEAMEIATVYDAWQPDTYYAAGVYLTYGVNAVGDPQLYKVVQAHTSQADWKPDKVASLYDPIGLDADGHPIWSAPTGAHDAYAKGDIVDYNGTLYQSEIDGNTTVPGTDTRYWTVYAGN